MVRLLLHSDDSMLQSLLSVTLGSEFQVAVESDRNQVKRLLEEAQADVLIQDFDSNDSSLDDLLGFLREVSSTRVPIVVMTDDDRRSTVLELMQHGVFDYFRKPPHLQELRVVVRRAHEHAQLKAELQKARERLRRISSC